MDSAILYRNLSMRARVTLLSAIFFVFSPIAMLMVANVGKDWNWVDVAGWLIGSALIAVCWAYAFFKGRHYWLPIILNAAVPVSQRMFFSGSLATGNAGFTITGLVMVVAIVIGYIMFVIFIRGEGAKTVHLQAEMELAKEIHDHLVPEVTLNNEQWEILGSSSASSEVGGDMLDVMLMEKRVIVTVADVSGHGVRAGVMMAMIKSALKTTLLRKTEQTVCADLNNVVYALKRPDMYATGVHLELHTDHTVTYTGAGHPSLLHINGADKTCASHESQNPPLGVVKDLPFAQTQLSVKPGDLLVILTDGLTEVENKGGEMFGEERIQQLIREKVSRPLAEIRAELLKSVDGFGAQEDDQTLVLIRAK